MRCPASDGRFKAEGQGRAHANVMSRRDDVRGGRATRNIVRPTSQPRSVKAIDGDSPKELRLWQPEAGPGSHDADASRPGPAPVKGRTGGGSWAGRSATPGEDQIGPGTNCIKG